jgi:hypothetical protein
MMDGPFLIRLTFPPFFHVDFSSFDFRLDVVRMIAFAIAALGFFG